MKQWINNPWQAFVNIATVFSFAVNLVLVLVLILFVGPIFQLKTGVVEPLLWNLDRAFQRLGETSVETTVEVDEPIGIQFELPLDQSMDLDFDLTISEETAVVLSEPVPLNVPATFTLPGFGGEINGTVSLNLPAGMRLPVQLNMTVPVQRTIPVQMVVPVSETMPIQMAIPVSIQLGEAGLDPAVQQLRQVFAPIRDLIESLPDGFRFRK
jgi:hypothetical protein